VSIEYDPNRSSFIALLQYEDGEKRYMLAPQGLKVGMSVLSSSKRIEPDLGSCMPMGEMPQGIMIHNVEMRPGCGGAIARSAGVGATLMAKEGRYVIVVLPSGEMRRILSVCRATVGQIGNLDHQNVNLGKAGRNHYKGYRGHVRGLPQNPVDHPMGGGETRSKGHHPQSPWGLYAKGKKTRNPKALSNRLIMRRRKK
jgi:large subunit ribosomal protein L2